jgi:hypothetical protein
MPDPSRTPPARDRARLVAWWAAVAAASVLMVTGLAYYLTYEPAPEIRIRWRDGVTVERRAELERRFRLVNPNPHEDRLSYDLLDTRRSNIEAIVRERDVYDTDVIRQRDFTLPPDYPYGKSWMWIAYRIPVLRMPGVVQTMVAICGAVLVTSAGVMIVRRRRAPRGHA